MKTKPFILLSLFLLAITAYSATAVDLFSENFEQGPLTNKWETVTNTQISNGGVVLLNGVGSGYMGPTGNTADAELVSFAIDTTGHNDITLSYWRRTISTDAGDQLIVQYSTDNGVNWNIVETVVSDPTYTQNTVTLDVSANDNPNVKIRFYLQKNADDDRAALDDILVTGDVIDTINPQVANLNHQPANPRTSSPPSNADPFVNLCVNAMDNVGITNIQVHVDNGVNANQVYTMNFMGNDVYCKLISTTTEDAVDGMLVNYYVLASDADGNVAQTQTNTFVYDGLPPTVSINVPPACVEGQGVLTTASGSDTVTPVNQLAYQWDFDYDGTTFNIEGFGTSNVYPCQDITDAASPQDVRIAVRSIDLAGFQSAIATSIVTITDTKPTAGFTYSPAAPVDGDLVSFTDASVKKTDNIISWEWDFDTTVDSDGDGTTDNDVDSTEQNPTHTFPADGLYSVALKITDDDGSSDTITDDVEVFYKNKAPVITTPLPLVFEVTEGEKFSFTLTATDVENDELSIIATLPSELDWMEFDGLDLSGTAINPGTYEGSLVVTDGEDNSEPIDFTITIQPVLEITAATVTVNGKTFDGLTEDVLLNPGDQVSIVTTFVNNFYTQVGHVEVSSDVAGFTEFPLVIPCAGINCDGGQWVLEPNTPKTATFNFQVPYDADNFVLTLQLEEKDLLAQILDFLGLGNTYKTSKEVNFIVEQNLVDATLDNLFIGDQNLTCSKTVGLVFNLVNIGSVELTPELKVYDKSAVLNSINQAGEFTQFSGVPIINYEMDMETLPVGGSMVVDTAFIDVSKLANGLHTLYVYVVNPLIDENYVLAAEQIDINVGPCLNKQKIEEYFTIPKGTQKPALNLFEKVDGEYVYINEDNEQLESFLNFELPVAEQSNQDLITCELNPAPASILCGLPAAGYDGISTIPINISMDDWPEFQESFDVSVTNDFRILDVQVNGVPLVSGANSPEIKPNEKIKVTFKVANGLTLPVTDIAGSLASGTFSFDTANTKNAGASATISMEIEENLPLSTTSGIIPVVLEVTGKDYDKNTVIDTFNFNLNVVQDTADLLLTAVNLSATELTCETETLVNIELTNSGSNTEDDVVLTITGNNFDYEYTGFIIVNQNSKLTVGPISVPAKNLSSGSNSMVAKISYRNGFDTNSKNFAVKKSSCIGEKTPAATSLVLASGDEQEFTVNLSKDDFNDNIIWYVNDVVVASGETSYTFVADENGEFVIKVTVNGESKEWIVKVSNKPTTTKFTIPEISDDITKAELSNFFPFYLENEFGRIDFLEPVDLTGLLDLDAVVTIQEGLVAIDSANAPGLDRIAKITLFKLYNEHIVEESKNYNIGPFSTCTSCSDQSNLDGKFIFFVNGFSTFKVMENIPARVAISAIDFGDVKRGNSVNTTFTVSNTGSHDLTGLTYQLTMNENDYNAVISGDKPTTITAGSQVTLSMQVMVPEDEDGGHHSIGSIEVKSNQDSKTEHIFLNPKSFLVVKSIKINGKSSGGFSVDDETEIKVEVENEYTENMEDVEVTVTILDVDGDDLDESEDIGDLKKGKNEEVKIIFDLSNENLDEKEYGIEILVEGKAVDGTKHSYITTKTVDVDREKHKVIIDKTSLTPSTMQCVDQTSLTVTVKNIGESDEDEVDIKVTNSQLNLDLIKENIEVEKYSDKDNDYRAKFNIVPGEAEAGTYPLTIQLYLDGDLEETENVDLMIKGCGSQKTSGNSVNPVYSGNSPPSMPNLDLTKTQGKQNIITKFSFRDSDTYLYLLAGLIFLVFVAMILGMVVLATKRRRKSRK